MADRWLSGSTCESMVSRASYRYGDWRNGVGLFWPDWPVWDRAVYAAVMDVGKLIADHTGRKVSVKDLHLVHWRPDSGGMGAHRVIQKPAFTHGRDWATLVYLNDVDEGGATFFPDRDGLRIQPRTGRMMSCPCGVELHGVEPAVSHRWTMLCWWELG